MISRSTLLHLRIPFSLFLLPVYLFALSVSNNPDFGNVLLVFFILHILVYPASNGYNSYFDKDEGSIGALKHPPKVTKELYFMALLLDLIALILAYIISWEFALAILVYGLVSKAYSHPSVRLKRLPIASWMIAGFFQGMFSFLACFMGINSLGFEAFGDPEILYPAFLSSMLLWGSYPMTQIYQHEEDFRRGDITISLRLGILGTFHFTAIFFLFSLGGFIHYYLNHGGIDTVIHFLFLLAPMGAYFGYWYILVRKDLSNADFSHTMKLNLISSICFSVFFGWIASQNINIIW